MSQHPGPSKSFARGEVVAPAGLWERGAEASGTIPPSARLFHPYSPGKGPGGAAGAAGACKSGCAPKALATSPSGETNLSARSGAARSAAVAASALDIHASSVSPPPQDRVAPSPPPPTTSRPAARKRTGKKERHRLRSASGCILTKERVANCGRKAVGSLVTLHQHGGSAHFGGVETCGSVWACPVCAVKITEGRRLDIEAVLKGHRDAGGVAFMATLTIPHHRFQSCGELRRAVSGAWRKAKGGKAWVCARDRFAFLGDIRALEVTHGSNGWHPHLHVLIFFRPGTPKPTMQGFGGWLFDAWARAIERLGFGKCSADAFTFDVVNADEGAGEYVSKWGASLELTKAHIKEGRSGRTPWQILRDFSETRKPRDAALFREYALAFKGARQLTWSRGFKTAQGRPEIGIRERYLSIDEAPDEDLAADPQMPETHVATLDRPLFKAVTDAGCNAAILSAQEEAGLDGVLRALTHHRIPWRLSSAPGLERGRMVPLISLEPPPDGPEKSPGSVPGSPCPSNSKERFRRAPTNNN